MLRSALCLLALVAVFASCKAKIGDPCKKGIDCDRSGGRQCDISNLPYDPNGDGECTIENCSFGQCPKEATCVKIYNTPFLSKACDPSREDKIDSNGETLNLCEPHQVCLNEGLCADEIQARSSCRLKCKSNKDCRSGYKCVNVGARGIYRAPDPDDPEKVLSGKICTPDRDRQFRDTTVHNMSSSGSSLLPPGSL